MKAEERIAQLEAEVRELKKQLARALARIHELEGQQKKDSQSSSKPPSSDGLKHKTLSQRKRSGKKSGGQGGHAGHHLAQVESVDEIIRYRPQHCQHCQRSLEGVVGKVVERRQVQELPPLRLVVSEHQVEEVRCPQCQGRTRGEFPVAVKAPAQYGPRMRGLAVYLHDYQLLPTERTEEVLHDVLGCQVSEGSIQAWSEQAAQRLEPTMARIAEGVAASRVVHVDETGAFLSGTLHWIHTASTRFLTYLAWHEKRGREALEAIGVWQTLSKRVMHDRWPSYERADLAHSLCVAHLLRELHFLAEHEQQEWAADLHELLLAMHRAAQEWHARDATGIPAIEREQWLAQYFDLLARGFATQAQAPPPPGSPRRGRPKQSDAKNLLDTLLRRAAEILPFLDDVALPFTNNQAERDFRMVKVQQKIAGTFRSPAGLTAFCRLRSYLSTMRKQGHAMLDALTAVFQGQPLPVAWTF